MTLTPREERIVELTKQLGKKIASRYWDYPMGHAFIWGYITIRRAQKNGKVREFRVKEIIAYVATDRQRAAVQEMNAIPGVSGCWSVLD